MGGLYSVGTSAVFEFDANAYGNMVSGCNEVMLGDGGTDPGTINGVNQFYIQNRKGVEHPNYCVKATRAAASHTSSVQVGSVRPRMAPISRKKVA